MDTVFLKLGEVTSKEMRCHSHYEQSAENTCVKNSAPAVKQGPRSLLCLVNLMCLFKTMDLGESVAVSGGVSLPGYLGTAVDFLFFVTQAYFILDLFIAQRCIL